MKDTFRAADPVPLDARRVRKSRAFNRPGRLVLVTLLLLIAFVGFVAFLIGGIQLFRTEDEFWGWLGLAGLGTFVTTRILVFILARSLTCSLCHGTVMHEKRCRKHADAFRLWPLTHRASAVVSLIFTWTFRCMYCGTPFRLKK